MGLRTKRIIADTISRELGLELRDGRAFLERVLEIISDDLVYVGRVELRGFGTFQTNERKSRVTRHPRTGEPITIPARWVVTFRGGKDLRARLDLKPTSGHEAARGKKRAHASTKRKPASRKP